MMRALNKPSRPVAILSLVLAAFAVYWPSLGNQFVWDDTALILRDPFIRSWRLIPEGFRHFLFTDATASNFYRPLQRLTYTLDYALFAFHPAGYHFTSILLHALAAVALCFCAQALIERADTNYKHSGLIAWLTALAWAIHPVHSAAVCYVAGRADELAALFGFSALYFAARSCAGKSSRLSGWLAALCFLAALLSKESGITSLLIWLAALISLRDYARLRLWLGVAVAILAAYCSLRFTCESSELPPEQPIPIAGRPILAARAWADYAGLLVAPVNLHMERNIRVGEHGDTMQTIREASMREYETLAGILLIVAFVFWWRWARRGCPAACIFLPAFVIAYLPTSNLFSLNATAAEHWLYFSSALLFTAAALSLAAAPVPRRALAVALTVWLVFLGARTFVRNYDWKDQRTFLTQTLSATNDPARVLINLGVLESTEGHQNIAIDHFQKALNLRPDQPFALLGLANAYLREKDFDKAREQLQKAGDIPFTHATALARLAALDYQQHGTVRLDLLKEAADLEPGNWEIQSTYIKTLADDGKLPEAIAALSKVLETQSYRSTSWQLMGDLLEKSHRTDLASNAYAQARELDVHYQPSALEIAQDVK